MHHHYDIIIFNDVVKRHITLMPQLLNYAIFKPYPILDRNSTSLPIALIQTGESTQCIKDSGELSSYTDTHSVRRWP